MRVPYKKKRLASKFFFDVSSNAYHFEQCQFFSTNFYDCVIDDDLFVACEFHDCVFDGIRLATENNFKVFRKSNIFDGCLFCIYTDRDAKAFYSIFRRTIEDRVDGLGPWYLNNSNHGYDPNGFLDEMLRKEEGK